ncbi:MAG TPA: PKD domain-containing protein [Baekduia sp.]|nr:PKD domain-containing protein [Baekduia sp.]
MGGRVPGVVVAVLAALAAAAPAAAQGADTTAVVREGPGLAPGAVALRDGPAPRAPTGRAEGQAAVTPATSWCGDVRATDDVEHGRTTLRRFKVLYLHPSDRPNRLTGAIADRIQQTVSAIAGKYAQGSSGTLGVRFDYGTRCGPEFVDITSLRTTRATSAYAGGGDSRPDAIKTDVLAARASVLGLDRGRWDFLIFADLPVTGSYAEAHAEKVPDLRADPRVNSNAVRDNHMALLYADAFDGTESDEYTAYTATHEVTHTFGAVQPGAPDATGGWHCNDGVSLMCYADGSPGSAFDPTVCPVGQPAPFGAIPLDCGQDNYFNPSPAAGTWLADNWNVARHPAVCPASLCLASTIEPVAAATVADGPRVAGSPVRFDASGSGDRDGTIVRFDWDVDGDGTAEQSTTTPTLDVVPRRAGRVGGGSVTVLDDLGLTASAPLAAVEVAGRPPAMALAAPAPAPTGTPVLLDASASADPDEGGRIVRYRFTLGDGQVVEQAAPQLRWTPTRPGRFEVRVAGVDEDGLSGEAAVAVEALNRPPALRPRVPARPAANDELVLRAGATDDDGRVTQVRWDLGRGVRRSGEAVRVAFPATGRRTVRVTATDDLGAVTTQQIVLELVRGPLRAVRRSRRGALVLTVGCPRRDRACRLRADVGGRRLTAAVPRGAVRRIRTSLPARLRSRAVRITLRDRRSGRRLASVVSPAPRT